MFQKEKRNLNVYNSHSEKIILSFDKLYLSGSDNGIKYINIIDFLLEQRMRVALFKNNNSNFDEERVYLNYTLDFVWKILYNTLVIL